MMLSAVNACEWPWSRGLSRSFKCLKGGKLVVAGGLLDQKRGGVRANAAHMRSHASLGTLT